MPDYASLGNSGLQAYEIGDLYRRSTVHAGARCDTREARHCAGSRIRELHVFGHFDLSENHISKTFIAAAVPPDDFRYGDLFVVSKTLCDVDVFFFIDSPWLTLERPDFQPPEFPVEGHAIAFERHE